MSADTEDNEKAEPESSSLPPMFGPLVNGERTWIRVGEIDYELMGYLLSCHLIIEHYMDAYLKSHHPELDWEAARLTFGQRVALLSSWTISKPFNPVEGIKHLNSLRNRLGHRMDYRLTAKDMLPFVHYMQAIREHVGAKRGKDAPEIAEPLPKDLSPMALLELFTTTTAACFAGSVSRTDASRGVTKRTRG
ncbi:hypothetical protein [Burkholderia gladioli]|uniref:hypothetical protein n=1 Tax=Burkholderia gladioli TaxID=28095 RepID=UPI003D36A6A8